MLPGDVLPDLLRPGLTVVFVGTSVGRCVGARQPLLRQPTNRFWELLDATGLTESAGITSERDSDILEHCIGITDLVKHRAASSDSLLATGDYDVAGFLTRIEENAPTIVAFNGREAARRVARHLGHPIPAEGPLTWHVAGARAYRLPSSSAANARGGYARKLTAWRKFGRWARSHSKGPDGGRR